MLLFNNKKRNYYNEYFKIGRKYQIITLDLEDGTVNSDSSDS